MKQELLEKINKAPKKENIKTYEGKNNAEYIPIGILQTMLDEIFPGWSSKNVVSLTEKAVAVSVELTLPCDGDFFSAVIRSGVGAMPLKPGDDPNSVVPVAEAYAFKNACKKIGKRFGADLNREETLEYVGLKGKLGKG